MKLTFESYVRGELEEGFKAAFTAAAFNVFTRMNAAEGFQKVRPRVEIKVVKGAATGRRHFVADVGLREDAWHFDAVFQFVTSAASKDSAASSAHGEFVRQGCDLVGGLGQSTWGDSGLKDFPHLFVAEPMRATGDGDYLKDSDGVEYTTVGFAGIVCVRNAAWETIEPTQ
jgi:hypothetical protein